MHKFSMKTVAAATVIGGAIAGAVSASAALNLPTQNCSYMFKTNMKIGSRGVDVMNLQKVLNAYPQTRVAASGAGSPGMETMTFGPATRAAVKKFQALQLVELGITAPTGNVFAGTRGLLNAICVGNGGTTTGNTGGNTGTTGTTTTTTSGSVTAMLAASQPTSMLVAGQAGARLADVTFTGNGAVTSLQLQRIGVSTDQTLTNVYLYDGNTRITDAASVITGGYINFNNPNGIFMVSGSRMLTVRADVAGGTSGQSVGVKLNSLTSGGVASTFSNVMGNTLQIGSVQVASSTLTMNAGVTSVNAGAVNQILWSGSDVISTRAVNLRAATFKFVGSAPIDFAANLSLYVDGSRIAGPSMISAANNNKVTFDLGAAPFVLTTGSHTIELHGDIVKGSSRTYQFSIENAADLMLEDSNLAGVNVTTYVGSTAATQSNTVPVTSPAGTPTTISNGSVTVNVDPSFNVTKVTGGATNVPVGQFMLKAYGEDVKVMNLQVTFATTSPIATLNNVSLYANGGQIGTSQNFTGGSALTYNFGSSLIIPAGQTVTLTVKADVVNSSNAAYTSGTLAATIGGVSNNAQGQSSSQLVSVAQNAVSGNTLTVSSGAGTFANTAGFAAITVSPNTAGVKIGSFTIQANSAEPINVTAIGVNPVVTTYAITNISNLRVMSGGQTIGTPVGNPSTGTTTFSFPQITIPANGAQTFDVYTDIGGATSGSVQPNMDITYRGAISNTATTSTAAGVAITSAVSSLATSTLSASSPVGQFVVGGSTFGIATFTLKTAVAGTLANVRQLNFNVSTGGNNAIQSITVGGVTAPVVNGTSTVTGLSIPVSSTGTDVPVTVTFANYQNASNNPGSLTTTVGNVALKLTYVEATSGSGTVITDTTSTAVSNTMVDVASKPVVTVSTGGSSASTLVLGAESKVGEFTVTADANGKIAVGTTTLNLSVVGLSGAATFGTFRLADGNTTVPNTTTSVLSSATTTATVQTVFSPVYNLSAGTSKVFSLFGTISGTPASGITPYVATNASSTGFAWQDVNGGNTAETGASIYNFPTNSYTTSH